MKPPLAGQHRLLGERRDFGAAIDAVAEADSLPSSHQLAQRAQHLVLAAEIAELARQEHVVAPLGDPRLDPVPVMSSVALASVFPACKNLTLLYAKT